MTDLFKNNRFYILVFSLGLSVVIYFLINKSTQIVQVSQLTQTYALIALAYLYITLLIGPLVYQFKFIPFRGKLVNARRALGVSAFYFALLHALLGFFGELGGFSGLPFLDGKFLLAIFLSFIALIILALLAATSIDWVIEKITFDRWKFLQRFVYLASVFILIHALLLGSHFSDISGLVPSISFFALMFLLFLEARRIDFYLQNKFSIPAKYKFVTSLIIVISVVGFVYYLFR